MPGPPSTAPRLTDRLVGAGWRTRRAVLSRRRPLAFLLATLAVLAGVRATSAPTAPTVAVTVAARDLAAGVTLRPGDLTVVDLRRATAPGGRVRDPVGAVLAGPMRHGEVVTDARLVGPALSAGQPGMVTVPVRFPDAGMVALLHVGDRIDVLAAAADGGPPTVLARDCRVLALPVTGAGPGAGPGAENGVAAGGDGRLVVLGVPESAATSVSAASPSHFLTFTFAR